MFELTLIWSVGFCNYYTKILVNRHFQFLSAPKILLLQTATWSDLVPCRKGRTLILHRRMGNPSFVYYHRMGSLYNVSWVVSVNLWLIITHDINPSVWLGTFLTIIDAPIAGLMYSRRYYLEEHLDLFFSPDNYLHLFRSFVYILYFRISTHNKMKF